jgi:type IV secretory pathway TraG/TraD family ATPase VirD4
VEPLADFCLELKSFWSWFHNRHSSENLYQAEFAKLHQIKPLLAKRRKESLLLGIGPYQRPIRVQPTPSKPQLGNVLDLGTSQCGKSTREIAQILEWQGSIVTNDIKRQIRHATAGWRSLQGPIFTVDVTGKGNKFDPLEGRITERQLYNSAYHLMYNPNDKEKYFTERGARMLTQLFLAAREWTRLLREENSYAKEVRPLPFVSTLLCLGVNRVAAKLSTISPQITENFLEAEYVPNKDYEEMKSRVDAWSTVTNRLYPILTDDIVPTFDGCDFTAKDLLFSDSPVTVYLCWPEADLKPLKPLIRLVWETLINDCINLYDLHKADVVHKVLCSLDEAGVTDLEDLPEKAATVNGRGMSLSLSAQDIEQFVTLYGESRAKSLFNNLESKVVHRMAGLDTAKHFREWLGDTSGFASSQSKHEQSESEGKSERDIPLLSVRQLAEMDDEDVIIFHRNYKPMQAHRMGVEPYPELVTRQPIFALPAPTPLPRFRRWHRRYLQPGASRLDPGPYALYAPETVARWPVMYRDEETA